jgi:RimJ/RimL family protein N-acetyltransferase
MTMRQRTLRTARLVLRPLSDEHVPFEVELDSDPEVMRFLSPRGARHDVVSAHAGRMARGRQVAGLGTWLGFTQDGDFVGMWMLQPPHGPSQSPEPGEADLGYRVLRRYWRRGLGSEAARELLRHGFEDLGLVRIFAQTMSVNTPSRATLDSLGLTFVRTFYEASGEPVPGSEEGEVEYEVRREAWLMRQRALSRE